MPNFKYTAIDSNGKQKTGTVSAENRDQATAKITDMGLMPTAIGESKGGTSAKGKSGKHKAKGKAKAGAKKKGKGIAIGKVLSPEGLTIFTRQLATLLQAGLPLVRALEVMIRQEKNVRFHEVLEQITDQVKGGNTFSDGLAQHPKIFDRLYINMIKAGEAGGVLDVVLNRLATFMEKALKTKKKVKAAMVYPFVIVSVAVGIVALLMVVVVPKFQGIFADMLGDAPLPGPTQVVISVSEFVQANIVLTLGLIVAFYLAFKFMIQKTKFGSMAFDWVSINTPKVGDLVRKVNIARITRTFGTLLSSGVPILQALTITKDITGNQFYTSALSSVHDRVRDGETVAAPMSNERVFPDMVTSMVEVGEETGELAEMLNRVADNYDEDVDNAVAGITSIIEPIMIVFLAVVVGFIVIALFLPIVEIIKQISG